MKRLIAILLGAVCILFCATDFGAAQSLELTGYRYTGKSEERTMDIWVSPGAAGQSADNRAIIQDCADRLPYYDKIQITWFERGSDFFSTLSKAVTAGNGPDVIVSSSEEWSTALIGRGYLLDLSTFFETCFSSGRLDDTRLCTDILDACRVRGELTVAPVRFSVRWVACTDAAADPLGLTREESFADYLARLKQIESDDALMASCADGISSPWIAFPNLIDEDRGTTRLTEPEIQNYCSQWIRAKRAQAVNGSFHAYSVTGRFQAGMIAVPFQTAAGRTTMIRATLCVSVLANTDCLQQSLGYVESLYNEEWALAYATSSEPYSVYRTVLSSILGMDSFFPVERIEPTCNAIYSPAHKAFWMSERTESLLNEFFSAYLTDASGSLPSATEYLEFHNRLCLELCK